MQQCDTSCNMCTSERSNSTPAVVSARCRAYFPAPGGLLKCLAYEQFESNASKRPCTELQPDH